MSLSASDLRALLRYDPDTGFFYWRGPPSRSVRAGATAGALGREGYRRIRINGARYYASRLAFLYMTGGWPKDEADHKNGMKGDDRWVNLREGTREENCFNRSRQKRHKSGYKGGFRHRSGRWQAQVRARGQCKYLGLFDTPQEAHTAYFAAARLLHREFARSA